MMAIRKKVFLGFVFAFLPFQSFAQEAGVVLGIRGDSADSGVSSVVTSGKSAMQIGFYFTNEINPKFNFKSGINYVNQQYEVSSSGTVLDFKFSYFELPLNFVYKVSDFGGFFVGPAVAFNLDKNCGSQSSCAEVSSVLTKLQLGGHFKIAPEVGADLYFENSFSKVSKYVESPKAVILNLFVTFE